ncbi:hypothetical protein AVEN_194677-1, partial [Araneus ventricosus]
PSGKFEYPLEIICEKKAIISNFKSIQHPDLARNRSGYLSDGRYNSSSAEVGVLMAITGHSPTPPEGGMHYDRGQAPAIIVSTSRGENPVTCMAASHPHTRVVPSRLEGDPPINAQHLLDEAADWLKIMKFEAPELAQF